MDLDQPEPLKSAQHHWWPRALSALWDSGTGVTRRLPNGTEVRARPDGFGKIKDGHSAKFRGPWSHSFEHLFDHADSSLPYLVKDILRIATHSGSLALRTPLGIRPLSLAEDELATLRAGVASLAVRSPRFRYISEEGTAAMQERMGFPVYRDPNILVLNIRDELNSFSEKLSGGGIYIFLYVRERRFIFGDGIYTNMYGRKTRSVRWDCIVPLTPNLAVYYFRMQGFAADEFFLFEVNNNVADDINNLTLIYSGSEIFYDGHLPADLSEFEPGEYRVLEGKTSLCASRIAGTCMSAYWPGISPKRTTRKNTIAVSGLNGYTRPIRTK